MARRLVEKAIEFVVGDDEDADHEVDFRDFVLETFEGVVEGAEIGISMSSA